MECPKCRKRNPVEAKFCVECGAGFYSLCSRCGRDLPPEAKFCPECGAKIGQASPQPARSAGASRLEDMQNELLKLIPPSLARKMELAEKAAVGENRLVTALFADISGFTSLSKSHPTEAVVEKVNECFNAVTDAVYRYEGSVNRFIGDCVLAFFGAPLTHENDPERALRAALEMRNAVSELGLEISVGVNTGMMYFGPIGTEQHLEVSAYGSDINLAKRLQEAAKPGKILVGSATHRLTRKSFDFDRQEALALKGME